MQIKMVPGIDLDSPEVLAVCGLARKFGVKPVPDAHQGGHETIVQVYMHDDDTPARHLPFDQLKAMPGVEAVTRISKSDLHRTNTPPYVVSVGSLNIGPDNPTALIMGQCTTDHNVGEITIQLAGMGILHQRGGPFKPRSDGTSFPGFGPKAVELQLTAAVKYGVETIWFEAVDATHIAIIDAIADQVGFPKERIVLWVGARTSNPFLLLALGQQKTHPVMIKNTLSGSMEELLNRAHTIRAATREYDEFGDLLPEHSSWEGNRQLMFCSRGINLNGRAMTHDGIPYRFDPEHAMIESLREFAPPVVLDPSHSAGDARLVYQNTRAGLVYNPDAVMIEVYLDPESGAKALCDAKQAVPLSSVHEYQKLIAEHNAKRLAA